MCIGNALMPSLWLTIQSPGTFVIWFSSLYLDSFEKIPLWSNFCFPTIHIVVQALQGQRSAGVQTTRLLQGNTKHNLEYTNLHAHPEAALKLGRSTQWIGTIGNLHTVVRYVFPFRSHKCLRLALIIKQSSCLVLVGKHIFRCFRGRLNQGFRNWILAVELASCERLNHSLALLVTIGFKEVIEEQEIWYLWSLVKIYFYVIREKW